MSEILSLKQKAYQIIKQKIIWGELQQGAPLREVQLSKELDISRTPIREVIAQLERDGLVVYTPGRGSMVKTFTAKDISDLYELREQLEIFSLEKMAQSISDESLRQMQECCENFKILAQKASAADSEKEIQRISKEMYAIDMNFHLQLLLNSKNKYVRKITTDLNIIGAVIMLSPSVKIKDGKKLAEDISEAYLKHKAILDAVESGKIDEACLLISEHLQSACVRLMKNVEKPKPQAEKNWKSHVAQTLQLLEKTM